MIAQVAFSTSEVISRRQAPHKVPPLWLLIILPAILFLGFPAASNSQTGRVYWNSDGTRTLTQEGWTLAGTPADQLTKSRDFSSGQADAGTDGVWNIDDNNVPGNAYMRMYRDPGGISSSQGIVMARVRVLGGGSTNGTFGYSTSAGHSVVMAIRPGQINWKTAEGGNANVSPVSLDTSVYRVYALRWYVGGIFDSWYSKTNDWSSDPADWVQVVSGGSFSDPQSALIDETGTARSGLLLGSFGSSSTLWNGNVDWIMWSKRTEHQQPWAFPPPYRVPDESQYVSDSIPATVQRGLSYQVSITLKNTGTATWTSADGYKLGALYDPDPFCGAGARVMLQPGDLIAPSELKTFTFTMTAPRTLGTYTTSWMMLHGEGSGAWFGDIVTKQVQVVMGTDVPDPPTIIEPEGAPIAGSEYPVVTWTGDPHDGYEIHIGSYNYPTSNDGWDSNEAYAGTEQTTRSVETGPLQPYRNYYIFIRLHNSNGWGAWSTGHRIYIAGEFIPVSGEPSDAPYMIADPDGYQWPYVACYNPAMNEYLVAYTDRHTAGHPDGTKWRASFCIVDGTGRKMREEQTIYDDPLDGVNVVTAACNPLRNQYLVVYVGWHESGGHGLRAQLVDGATGLKIGPSFTLMDPITAAEPVIAFSTVSRVYMLAFKNYGTLEINAWRLNEDGQPIMSVGADPVTKLINVTQAQPMDAYVPFIGYNPESDEFYIGYQVDAGVSNGFDIWGQAVTASTGALRGPTVALATHAPGWDEAGEIIYVPDLDKYLVVYQCNAGPNSIYGLFLDEQGLPSGSEFIIEDRSPSAGHMPAAAWNPLLREFLVTYGDMVTTSDFARRLSENGAPIGDRFRIEGPVTTLGNWDPTPFYNPVTDDFLIFWYNAYDNIWVRRLKESPLPTAEPPTSVTDFTAVAGNGRVSLAWRNPPDSSYVATAIRYKIGVYPTGPNDGILLIDKPNSPGSTDGFVHEGLTNGMSYYYWAFAHDSLGNYARAAAAVATPWRAPRVLISSSDFASGSDGWNLTGWKAGPYEPGTIAWSSGVLKCIGSGATDNSDRCNREGGEAWKVIPTVGCRNILLSWETRVNSLGSNKTGTGYGTCSVDHNRIEEQLTVFYSTDGGANWVELGNTRRDELLAAHQHMAARQIDLSGIPGASNNPGFALRFRWQLNSAADAGELDNIRLYAHHGSIAAIKALPNGTQISLADKVLYLKGQSFAYIEEQDRSSGIRIEGQIEPSVDSLISLSGTLDTTAGGERYIRLDEIWETGSASVSPIGSNNRNLMDNLMDGLFVTAWGMVKEPITENSFMITDGSDDGGIRVITSSPPEVSVGEYVCVSGAAGFDGARIIYRR